MTYREERSQRIVSLGGFSAGPSDLSLGGMVGGGGIVGVVRLLVELGVVGRTRRHCDDSLTAFLGKKKGRGAVVVMVLSLSLVVRRKRRFALLEFLEGKKP
jgi:hypothetical protein